MALPWTHRIAFAAIVAGVVGLSAVAQPEAASTDPFPIRRLNVSGDRLAKLVEQVDQGNLVRLPAADFDKLLLEARASRRPAQPVSALVGARYRAKYVVEPDGGSSLVGTAEWSVRRPAGASPEIPLPGFQLAVRQATWSDGQDALLYRLAGDPSARLHLPEGETRTLNLDWSARGLPEPGEVQFELHMAETPVATLDLELPASMAPVTPQGEALLTGPSPAGAGHVTWRVSFGGMSRLEIVLRRATETPSVLFTRTVATQNLSAPEGAARYEIQVESAKLDFTELVFQHDPGFVPTSVRVNNLAGWSTVPGEDGKAGIAVRLRESTRSAAVVITGTLTLPAPDKPWTSPGVWLKAGVPRSERLSIVVPPTLRFRDWSPHGFRLLRGAAGADRSYTIDAERVAFGGNVTDERPSLGLAHRRAAAWTVTQKADWRIGTDGETFAIRTTVGPNGTPPRTIRFPLPAGWQVERVDTGVDDAAWSVTDGPARKLEVELGSPGRKVEISVSMRRPGRPSAVRHIPYPDLLPEDCDGRSGTLTIRVAPTLEVIPSDPVPDGTAIRASASGDEFTRTLISEPPNGWLVVRPRTETYRIEIKSEIEPGRRAGPIRSSLTVRPEGGPVSEIALWTPGAVREPWEWRDERGRWLGDAVRVREREAWRGLTALAPVPAFSTAATLAYLSNEHGCRWRLRLPRAADRATTVYSDYGPDAQSRVRVWPVPWGSGLQSEGLVSLPADTPAAEIDPRWVPVGPTSGPEREFRYGSASGHLPPRKADGDQPEIEGLRLVTRLSASGDRRCSFRFRVRRWTRHVLPIELPESASDITVSVGGHPASLQAAAAGGSTVNVPVPANDLRTVVRVDYQLPAVSPLLLATLPRSPPKGPFEAEAIQYTWQLSPEWRVFAGNGFRLLPGSPGNSPTLPLPDWRGVLGLVGRNSTSSVPVAAKPRETVAAALARTFPNQVVLIDVRAVNLAGVYPSDVAEGGEPLKNWKLAAVQGPAGILVTDPAVAAHWNHERSWGGSWPDDVGHALEEAARYGQDQSGRFRSLERWTVLSAGDADAVVAPPDWIVADDDGSAADGPTVYRHKRVRTGCWLLAIALGVAALAFIRSVRVRLIAVLAACGAVLALQALGPAVGQDLSPAVLLTSIGVALCSVRWREQPRPANRPSVHGRLLPVTVAIVLATVAAVGQAAPVAPADVYQVLDADGKPTDVLVPRPVLERLRANGLRTTPAAIISSASYSAAASGGAARVHARYKLFNFGDHPTAVTVPLHGVRYRTVTLDGAEARDIDSSPDGLRVMVGSKGVHVLEVDFSVPVAIAGTEREVKFAIPETPESALTFELPETGQRLYTAAWRGAVRTAVSPRATTLTADLGQSPTIALRWPGAGERRPVVKVSGVSVWQIGTGSGTLTSAIDYRISDGPTADFQIAIPAQAELYRLTAVGEATIAGMPAVRIKDWTASPADAPGPRRLHIRLLHPVQGRVSFGLEMVSTAPAAGRLSLQFPRALGATSLESFAAIEFQGVEGPAKIDAPGWVEMTVPEFQDSVKSSAAMNQYAGKPSRAFRSAGTNAGHISFPVRLSPPAVSVAETANWWVEPARVSGSVDCRWTGTALSFLEWTVPASLTVTDISGKSIAAWAQSGGRVQVWLDRPLADAALTWRAHRTRGARGGPSVEIPAIQHAAARSVSLVRRVRSFNGWVLAPLKGNSPKEFLPAQAPGELAWRGSADQRVIMSLLPPPANAAFRLRTTVEARDDRIQSTHRIDLRALRPDRPYVMSILVAAGRDDDVQLAAPPAAAVTEVGTLKSAIRRWDIGLPTGLGPDSESTDVRVTSKALGSASWNLPQVSVRFGPDLEPLISESISVESDSISLTSTSGLERLDQSHWRVTRRPWQAGLMQSAGLKRGEKARVNSATMVASRSGREWVYRCDYDIACSETLTLQPVAPAGAQLRSVELDGSPLALADVPELGPSAEPRRHSLRLAWSSPDFIPTPVELINAGQPVIPMQIDLTVGVPPGQEVAGAVAPIDQPVPSAVEANSILGSPHRFRVSNGQAIDLHLVPVFTGPPTWQVSLAAGLWTVALVIALFGVPAAAQVVAACISGLAVLSLGPAAGVLLVVPAAILVRRIGRAIHSFTSDTGGRDRGSGTS